MAFSKIPTSADLSAPGAVLHECYETVNTLKKLHLRDTDFPPLMTEAAALYDTALTISGLHAKSFPTIDLAKPYMASATILAHLETAPEIDRLGENLLHSAEDLAAVTPEEAFLYQTNQRDAFSDQRLAELDFATTGRFAWIADQGNDVREAWAIDLFDTVAR